MEIITTPCKRINVNSKGLHILAIHHKNNFYRFQLQHDKYKSVLTMFGGNYAQVDDETMKALLYHNIDDYLEEYQAMIEAETSEPGEYFAVTRWMVEDVQALRPEWTKEQAASWWKTHERAFSETLTQYGNEILSNMLSE